MGRKAMDERFLEQAEKMVAAELQTSMTRNQRAMTTPGTADCMDCGDPIPADRRAAAPFATRCIECQQGAERGRHVA